MIRTTGLSRNYHLGGQEVRAVDGVNLSIREGEYLRVVGASGSGKSTLLNLIAGLDRPTSGRIETPLGELSSLSRRDRSRWRSDLVGMVFQTFNLVPHRTALQNVELGLLFCSTAREEVRGRATGMLTRLGLGARLHHRPADLSGGEQQRVALARALVKSPRLLLADEPTGNLDEENARQLSGLLAEENGRGMTVVLVTHDASLAAQAAHRTVRMNYGRIIEEIFHLPTGASPEIPPNSGGQP